MGKDTTTPEAFEIAKEFVQKRLPPLVRARNYRDLENIFPLSHVSPERAAIRNSLWKSIEEKAPMRSDTVRDCRAALHFFSQRIFIDAIAAGKQVAYGDPEANYLSSSERPAGETLVDARQPKFSRVKVKKIADEKDWYETKLELLKLIFPMITNYMDRAMIKRQIQETAYYLTSHKSRETELVGKPQDLIFNALIFSVLSILHLSKGFTRKEAEALTTELLNEYCYRNPRISSLVRKLTQKKVSGLYDNSPLRNAASFRTRKSD